MSFKEFSGELDKGFVEFTGKLDAPGKAPYQNKVQALDDAVNLIEEGVDRSEVFKSFGAIAKPEDIIAHAQKRGSYAPEAVDPEVAKLARNHPAPKRVDELKASSYAPKAEGLQRVEDLSRGFVGGAIGGFKGIADVFGANNAVSKPLDDLQETILDGRSQQAKSVDLINSYIEKESENKGLVEQVVAGWEQFSNDPTAFVASGAGSIVPMILGGKLLAGTKGVQALGSLGSRILGTTGTTAAQTAGGAVTGGLMGVGMGKSQIYETVLNDAIDAGHSKEEAALIADKAQSYTKNPSVIALTGALGAAGGATGAEAVVAKFLTKGAVKELAEQGVIRGVATGVAKETPLEAAQGGSEQFAGNVASRGAGFDVNLDRGVYSNAVKEGLASAPMGAATGGMEAFASKGAAAERQKLMDLKAGTENAVKQSDIGAIMESTSVEQAAQKASDAVNRNVSQTADELLASAGVDTSPLRSVVPMPSSTQMEADIQSMLNETTDEKREFASTAEASEFVKSSGISDYSTSVDAGKVTVSYKSPVQTMTFASNDEASAFITANNIQKAEIKPSNGGVSVRFTPTQIASETPTAAPSVQVDTDTPAAQTIALEYDSADKAAEAAQSFGGEVSTVGNKFVVHPPVTDLVEKTPEQFTSDVEATVSLRSAGMSDATLTLPSNNLSDAEKKIVRIAELFNAPLREITGKNVVLISSERQVDGVAYQGNYYLNIKSLGRALGASAKNISAHVGASLFHEATHTELENSTDPELQQKYQELKGVILQYQRDKAADTRTEVENSAAKAEIAKLRAERQKLRGAVDLGPLPQDQNQRLRDLEALGSLKFSQAGANTGASELVADVSGGMMVSDPEFWKRVYDLDNGSTMRRIGYKFMEYLTKLIGKIPKGSRFDVDALITQRDQVREALAQAWATKATGGKLMPRSQINEMLSKPFTPSNLQARQETVEPLVQYARATRGEMRDATPEDYKAFKIPPAYTDAKVATDPKVDLQWTAKNAGGLKKYGYTDAYNAAQHAEKFARMQKFYSAYPALFDKATQDASQGNETALVLRLISLTGFRVGGNPTRSGKAEAYGASTLQPRHVKVDGDLITFNFTGKQGVTQSHAIKDQMLADAISARMDRKQLFDTNDGKVLRYLKSIGGKDFKTHDFRTNAATEAAKSITTSIASPSTPAEFWDAYDVAIFTASVKIGDTAKVTEQTYVDPRIFDQWRESAGVPVGSKRPKLARKSARPDGNAEANDGRANEATRQGNVPASFSRAEEYPDGFFDEADDYNEDAVDLSSDYADLDLEPAREQPYFDEPVMPGFKKVDNPLANVRPPNTPEFRRFIGDTKWAHPDGTPMIGYHGTAADIESFRAKQAGVIFVAPDNKFAEQFSNMSAVWMREHYTQILTPRQVKEARARAVKEIMGIKEYPMSTRKAMKAELQDENVRGEVADILGPILDDYMPSGENVIPVWVSAQNPFDYDHPGDVKLVVGKLKSIDGRVRITPAQGEASWMKVGDVHRRLETGEWNLIESPEVMDAVKSLGFDSIYVTEQGRKNIAVFKSSQIKSVFNKGAYDPQDDRISFSRAQEDTAKFKTWSEDLDVVDHGEYEGGPAVFRMYHGTTHTDITKFKSTGSKEGALGQGPYFTTNSEDASVNYAGMGPDLTIRIAREEERVADSFYEDDNAAFDMLQDYLSSDEYTGDPVELTDGNFEDLKDEHGQEAIAYTAKNLLKGESDGLMMPVYVKVKKPFDMRGDQGTILTMEEELDEDGDPIGDPVGSFTDLMEAMDTVAGWYNADISDVKNDLYEQAFGGVSAKDVFDAIKIDGLYDDNGEMVSSGQFMQDVAREAGYDALIQPAWEYFGPRKGFFGINLQGMKGLDQGTLHIVPFTSNQVKSSIGNNGEFSLKNDDIRYSRAAGPKELKFEDNYLVPEVDGAFDDDSGNIAVLPAIQFARDGLKRYYPSMPVRIRVGQHGLSGKQYGLQHRIDNQKQDPNARKYITPALGDDSKSVVERAARDITLGVLDSQTAYADSSPTKVYLHSPTLNVSTVLEKQKDSNDKEFWSVVTSMPSTREQMARRYKAPTSIFGLTLNGDRSQQSVETQRGILNKLREPGRPQFSAESYIVDEDGRLFKGQDEKPIVDVVVKPRRTLARDENGKIILNKAKLQLSRANQTETPEFKRWWGDENTMVDANGKPLVLYHGTTKAAAKQIGVFRRSKYGAMGAAIYLGDSPESSAGYDQGAMLKVYARGKYLGNRQWSDYVAKHGWSGAEEAARADGWSGVYDQQFESAIAVWDSQDIKSADKNSGAFDPANPDIRYSRSELGYYSALESDLPPFSRSEESSNAGESFYDQYRNDRANGRRISDDGLIFALSGADKKSNPRWGYVEARSTNDGEVTTFWNGSLAGKDGYHTSAVIWGKDGERKFIMPMFPAGELVSGSKAEVQQAIKAGNYAWYLYAVESDGAWTVGVDGAEPGQKHFAKLKELGQLTAERKGHHRLSLPDGTSEWDLLREGARRLSMALDGNTPALKFNRETGANPREKVTTLSPERVEARFSRSEQPAPDKRESQIESENFKAWFKDSKVVDVDGKPLVVYHGTNADISEFSRRKMGVNTKAKSAEMGFFFAGSYKTSQAYLSDPDPLRVKATEALDYPLDTLFTEVSSGVYELDATLEGGVLQYEIYEGGDGVHFGVIERHGQERSHLGFYKSQQEAKRAAERAFKKDFGEAIFSLKKGPNIMPVYLSMQNPYTHDMDGARYRDRTYADIIESAVGGGHDGVVIKNTYDGGPQDTIYVVFNPTQIKSAIGNNGNFDPANPDIRYSRAQGTQGQRFSIPGEIRGGKLDLAGRTAHARRIWQDYFLPVLTVQNAILGQGGIVTEVTDVHKAEERMHGRIEEAVRDFRQKHVDPMIERLQKLNITPDELALYAYAKHAPSRNAHIAKINKRFPDGGSGMTNAEAAAILAQFKAEGKDADLARLHADLMATTAATRREMLEQELITQDEYDSLEGMFEYYVPLRGLDEDVSAPIPRKGGGFNIRGKETMRALGRRSRASDIIENIVSDYENTVARGEKNAVGKRFLQLVKDNPDPGLWEIDAVRTKAAWDNQAKKVGYRAKIESGPDTVAVKVNGKEVYIKIHDENLLRAMRRHYKTEMSGLERTVSALFGGFNDILRASLTQYNPVFGFVNYARDVQMGAVGVLDTLGGKAVGKFGKYQASSMATAQRYVNGKLDMTNPVDRMFEEFRAAGATTGGFYAKDVEHIRQEIRNVMLAAGAAPKGWVENVKVMGGGKKGRMIMKGVQGVGRYLEHIGQVSENSTRFAAYRVAREMDKSPAEAASIAKNLTTNFNRKGEWGQTMNTAYLFFNAAMQGSHRVVKALKNRKVQGLMAGMTAAGAGLAMLAIAVGGDDEDDGQAYWDKIPAFEKERNFIIMLPPGDEMVGAEKVGTNGRYIKIPMPYGFSVFPTLGYTIADVARNQADSTRGVSVAKGSVNMISAFMGSFNPFGGAVDLTSPTGIGMALAPTMADVVIQQASGRNSFDRPTAPYKSEFDLDPDSENVNPRQAGGFFHMLARGLNYATGGDQSKPGAIDVAPGTLENAVKTVTGGTGTFLTDVFVNLPTKLFDTSMGVEAEITGRDIPIWRNFVGSVDGMTDASLLYERRRAIMKARTAQKNYEELGLDPEKMDSKDFALAYLAETSNFYSKALSAIKKQEIALQLDKEISRGDRKLQMKELRLQRDELTRSFNAAFMDVMRAERDGDFAVSK